MRRQYEAPAPLSLRDSCFFSETVHDCFLPEAVSLADFIPADHFFTLRPDDLVQAGNEICLKQRGVFDSLLLHKPLHSAIFFPITFITFVATDMNVFTRE